MTSSSFKYAAVVFIVIIFLFVITKIPGPTANRGVPSSPESSNVLAQETRHLLALSRQDNNPLMGLVHATMASSRLHALRLFARLGSTGSGTQQDFDSLREQIIEVQQMKLKEIGRTCPILDTAYMDMERVI